MSLSAPYVVTNIIFDKDDRFRFGSKKQHAVNNMLFFEAAVRQEMKGNGLSLEENNKPHKWNYDLMLRSAKDAEFRKKLPRGMTARQDPVVANKIASLKRVLQDERARRESLAPHYMAFLRLFDGVNHSVHDEHPPIPLSSQARARRQKIEERRRARESRPSMKVMAAATGRTVAQLAAARSRLRGPKMTMSQAQVLLAKAKGKKVYPPGIMSQTASRGLT